MIFVSHDRYFLNALADRTVEIAEGRLNSYDAGYDEYTELKRRDREEAARISAEEKLLKRREEKEVHYRSKKERADEAKRKERIKSIEAKICALEEEENSLNLLLSDSEVAADYKRVNEILSSLQTIKLQLDQLYNEYESMIE